LIVGATNSDLAQRIVYSSGVQNTPNVDTNPLKGKINVTTWARLDRSGQGTNTSAYWFLADRRLVQESLLAPFAQKPQMGAADTVSDTLDWSYPVDLYYAIMAAWPFGVWGSTGAN
jgi:hypothetical protein